MGAETMTEKQYRLNKWGTRLLKNNRPLFDWTNESDEIVDLLNSLNDENEELKRQIGNLEHTRDFVGDVCADCERLEKENEELKEQLSEAKADEKQLGISFMGYKMKLIEVLQKKYDKVKGKTLYADVYTEIAEEMGVDLE